MANAPTTAVPPPELWDASQLAEYLGTGQRFIHRITSENRIRYLKAGGKLRFAPEDVAEFIEREKSQNDPATVSRPAPMRGRPRAR